MYNTDTRFLSPEKDAGGIEASTIPPGFNFQLATARVYNFNFVSIILPFAPLHDERGRE